MAGKYRALLLPVNRSIATVAMVIVPNAQKAKPTRGEQLITCSVHLRLARVLGTPPANIGSTNSRYDHAEEILGTLCLPQRHFSQ